MIEFVEGILVEKHPTHLVVQCGGFGLRLLSPLSTYDALPGTGQHVKICAHLAVREDDLTLYGFANQEAREMFERLLLVSGVGPKLALTALSGMTLRELRVAIVDGDIKRLSSISGIGKKTAERIVVELRDKFGKADTLPGAGAEPSIAPRLRDAILALVALGFKQQEARQLLEALPEKDQPGVGVDELVRKALASRR